MSQKHDFKVIERYNHMLVERLNRYLKDTASLWNKKELAGKSEYDALLSLKQLMDDMAIYNLKKKEAPIKSTYKLLYNLLFESHFYRKSFLEVVKEGNQEEIASFEEKIHDEIISHMKKTRIVPKTLPSDIRNTVERMFFGVVESAIGSFSRIKSLAMIPLLLLLFVNLNLAAVSAEATANTPFTSEKERIMEIQKDMRFIVQNIKNHPEYGSLGFVEEGIYGALDKEVEHFIDTKLNRIERYLMEKDVLNPDFWSSVLINKNSVKAIHSAKVFLKEKFGPGYNVSVNEMTEIMKETMKNSLGLISMHDTLLPNEIHNICSLVFSEQKKLIKEEQRVKIKSGEIVSKYQKNLDFFSDDIRVISVYLDDTGSLNIQAVFLGKSELLGNNNEYYAQKSHIATFTITPNTSFASN
ncbi:hypothetical protein ACFLTH_08985 [Bacteroidota bacterium]